MYSNDPHAWHPNIPTHDTAGAASHSTPRGENPGKLTPLHLKHANKIGAAVAQPRNKLLNQMKRHMGVTMDTSQLGSDKSKSLTPVPAQEVM